MECREEERMLGADRRKEEGMLGAERKTVRHRMHSMVPLSSPFLSVRSKEMIY